MPLSMLMECVESSDFVEMTFDGWRCVEDQRKAATMDLVDSSDEQAILEGILDEESKPPVPDDCKDLNLHYLLYTPFRYPPLRYGSRFGSTRERSLWYGSLDETTTLAETAYYRMRFFDDSDGDMHIVTGHVCAFSVDLQSEQCVDLTCAKFAEHQRTLRDQSSYKETHEVGRVLRAKGTTMFKFLSARCDGTNFALFSPSCFKRKEPLCFHHWRVSVGKKRVIFERGCPASDPKSLTYTIDEFLVDGKFPNPS